MDVYEDGMDMFLEKHLPPLPKFLIILKVMAGDHMGNKAKMA